VAASAPASFDPDMLLRRARSIIESGARDGVPMRLLGGIAVYALAPSVRRPPLSRAYHDLDLAVPAKRGPAASRVLEANGFQPDRHFNALHGARRMIFDARDGFRVDVLIGTFEMCHTLEIGDAFDADATTIAPSHLLLTKLQIVAIEPKDLADAAALVLDAPLGSAPGEIDVERFVRPLAEDWGFFHTVELNLPKLRAFGEAELDGAGARTLGERVDGLARAMDAATKSLRWRLRARVGERVVWYETPEEVD
jgi:hypothetical protein